MAKKSVGKSIPFSMFKVKKPDNFEEIIKRVEEERIKQRVKKFFTKSKQFKNNIIKEVFCVTEFKHSKKL